MNDYGADLLDKTETIGQIRTRNLRSDTLPNNVSSNEPIFAASAKTEKQNLHSLVFIEWGWHAIGDSETLAGSPRTDVLLAKSNAAPLLPAAMASFTTEQKEDVALEFTLESPSKMETK